MGVSKIVPLSIHVSEMWLISVICDIITAIWSHYSQKINTYPCLVTIYRNILIFNKKDMYACNSKQHLLSIYVHTYISSARVNAEIIRC